MKTCHCENLLYWNCCEWKVATASLLSNMWSKCHLSTGHLWDGGCWMFNGKKKKNLKTDHSKPGIWNVPPYLYSFKTFCDSTSHCPWQALQCVSIKKVQLEFCIWVIVSVNLQELCTRTKTYSVSSLHWQNRPSAFPFWSWWMIPSSPQGMLASWNCSFEFAEQFSACKMKMIITWKYRSIGTERLSPAPI